MEVVEMQVGDIPGIGSALESLNETVGDTCNTAQMNVTVRGNMADSLVSTDKLYFFHTYKFINFYKF